MYTLGWGVGGEAWKWRRRLFAWEELLVGECVERLSVLVVQVGLDDRWVWKLHPSNKYTVQTTYFYLTAVDINITEDFHHFMWHKAVPLKVNIFVWRLFLNRLATKDNLRTRHVLDVSQVPCAASCGAVEDRDHLFFKCDHYGCLWLLISHWLGIDTVLHGNLYAHSYQFCALGGFSKNSRTTFSIIWISTLFVIWKDRNDRIFDNNFVQLTGLLEKVKLQTYWWLKANYMTFDFNYPFWRQNPLCCFQAVL